MNPIELKEAVVPITQRLIPTWGNLGLLFPTEEEEVANAYFFKVLRSNRIHRIYTALTTITTASPTVDFGILGELGHSQQVSPYGASVTAIDEDVARIEPFRIQHFSIGVKPDGIRTYIENPTGFVVDGEGKAVKPKPGDDFGYIPSEITGFEIPTSELEQIITPRTDINIGFHLEIDTDTKPILKLFGAGYHVAQYTDKGVINDFIAGRRKIAWRTVGGLRVYGLNVPNEWGRPTRVDKAVIEAAMRGGVAP